ncbi:MAG: MarR family transcriptional regulator [candidate division Zixibacteria bacterium]|nr:MarR family transcriptional regulator [candidate division Zixibacteria bacterium]
MENIENRKMFIRGVGRLWFIIKRLSKNKLAENNYDLTMEQVMVLNILEKFDGMSIKQLSEITERDSSTTSRMVNGLEKKNYVLRVPDQNDNRQKKIYITNKSKEKLKETIELGMEIQKVLIGDIDQKQFENTAELLHNIADRLEPDCRC